MCSSSSRFHRFPNGNHAPCMPPSAMGICGRLTCLLQHNGAPPRSACHPTLLRRSRCQSATQRFPHHSSLPWAAAAFKGPKGYHVDCGGGKVQRKLGHKRNSPARPRLGMLQPAGCAFYLAFQESPFPHFHLPVHFRLLRVRRGRKSWLWFGIPAPRVRMIHESRKGT